MRSENRKISKAVFCVFAVVLLMLGAVIGTVVAFDVWVAKTVRGDQDRVRQLMQAFMRVRLGKWYADTTRKSAGKKTPRMRCYLM